MPSRTSTRTPRTSTRYNQAERLCRQPGGRQEEEWLKVFVLLKFTLPKFYVCQFLTWNQQINHLPKMSLLFEVCGTILRIKNLHSFCVHESEIERPFCQIEQVIFNPSFLYEVSLSPLS